MKALYAAVRLLFATPSAAAPRSPTRGFRRAHDNDYWHVTRLPAGTHRVRVVVRPDSDARSSGRKIDIERAVVYGTAVR